jgi:hypothetical protein
MVVVFDRKVQRACVHGSDSAVAKSTQVTVSASAPMIDEEICLHEKQLRDAEANNNKSCAFHMSRPALSSYACMMSKEKDGVTADSGAALMSITFRVLMVGGLVPGPMSKQPQVVEGATLQPKLAT